MNRKERRLNRIEANRANAQLSTGPRTEQGKAKSSLNAVKTGLTGHTVLLPSEDVAQYERHIQRFFAELKPVGESESSLVQSLADTEWRLQRIPSLEMGIYAMGRLEFAEKFNDQTDDASVRAALIETHTYLTYQRQLNNLSIQESRLRRQREKDTAELHRLQQERLQQEPKYRTPAGNGFEFSFRAASVSSPDSNFNPVLPNCDSIHENKLEL
jgi:hypothetical protein